MSDHESNDELATADLGSDQQHPDPTETDASRDTDRIQGRAEPVTITDGSELHEDDANPDLRLEALDIEGLSKVHRPARIF